MLLFKVWSCASTWKDKRVWKLGLARGLSGSPLQHRSGNVASETDGWISSFLHLNAPIHHVCRARPLLHHLAGRSTGPVMRSAILQPTPLPTPKYTSLSWESRAPKLNRGCFICKARLWKTLLQLSKIRERNGGLVVAYCILTTFNFTGTWAFTAPIYNSLVCVILVMARF